MHAPDDAHADIGLIGLAVMGQNLALNVSDQGFTIAVYNRTTSVTEAFLAERAADASVIGAETLEELVARLARPRKVVLLVRAGRAVDAVLDQLVPLLEPGDIVLDGGNSHFPDTRRRQRDLDEKGIRFLGVGISGGEEGARHGPSIMPGGPADAYEQVAPILRAIAAKAPDGEPCVAWLGEDGAGHFVKMVHNGIEYADMQMIAESYQLMKDGLGLTNEGMQAVFARWDEGVLDSYLIEITADILGTRDEDGSYVLDRILDAAGQKGTGRWTAVAALEQGVPLTVVDEAVAARSLSAQKEHRERAEALLRGPDREHEGDAEAFLSDLHDALYASKIVAYAQGMALLRAAAREHDWSLDPGRAAALWRAGCIIRSRFLDDITAAYREDPQLSDLLLAPFFAEALVKAQEGWRRTVARAATLGVPAPALSAALAYYDGVRSGRGPANLIQAQRDYFGAHTFERIDRPRGEFVHFDWIGSGGGATSGGYEA
jgi:6-phosphogluconate dehydrogenase